MQQTLVGSHVWQPDPAGDELTVVLVERFGLRDLVVEIADVVDELAAGNPPRPFDAIRQDRYQRVVYGCALIRPPLVSNHDLVGGDALLRSPNEDVAKQRGHLVHEARLTEEPLLLGAVVHVADCVTEALYLRKSPLEQQAKIAHPIRGAERHLLLAVRILCVSRIVPQEAAAQPRRDVGSFVTIPGDQLTRGVPVCLGGIELVIERRVTCGGLRGSGFLGLSSGPGHCQQRAHRSSHARQRPGTRALHRSLMFQPLLPECWSLHGHKLPGSINRPEPEAQYV